MPYSITLTLTDEQGTALEGSAALYTQLHPYQPVTANQFLSMFAATYLANLVRGQKEREMAALTDNFDKATPAQKDAAFEGMGKTRPGRPPRVPPPGKP